MTTREFEIFVGDNRKRLLSIARQYVVSQDEAEDVVQDALLKLLAIHQRLDTREGAARLSTVVVKRLSLNLLRSRGRHKIESIDSRQIVAEEATAKEDMSELLRAIEALPSKQQTILRLKHLEGMEVEDIASMVQMSRDAIYQNLSRARRAILERFKTKD